jgi:hypothetical protein
MTVSLPPVREVSAVCPATAAAISVLLQISFLTHLSSVTIAFILTTIIPKALPVLSSSLVRSIFFDLLRTLLVSKKECNNSLEGFWIFTFFTQEIMNSLDRRCADLGWELV